MTSARRRVTILNPLKGEDGRRFPTRGYLGPNTINVLPDNRGYLCGFTGNHAVIAPPAAWAGLRVVEATSFRNRLGVVRRVFVTDDWQVWSLEGFTPVLLRQFAGKVKLETFQDLVIFLSITEAPRKWDGVEGVTFLGVREIPAAPTVRVAGGTNNMWDSYFRRSHTWGISNETEPFADAYVPWGPLQDRNSDRDAQQDRSFEWSISFYNTRGQRGRRGPATQFVVEKAEDVLLNRNLFDVVTWQQSQYNFLWPIVEWLPVFEQEDIAGAIVWRTVNQGVAEEAGLFQLAYIIPLPCTRITDTKADGALATAYDDSSGWPGPQGLISAVYKGVVLIAGDPEDRRIVRYCVAGTPEDWPISNSYMASDDVTAMISLSKSVVIVTKSTIETLQQTDTGVFVVSRIERSVGSLYGGTIVGYKDNAVGFWSSGFGVFDGFTFKQLTNTLGHVTEELEVDPDSFSWISPEGMLMVASQTRGFGRQILAYHFGFNSWFRLAADSVYCAWTEDDQVYVGGDAQIRAFNRSNTGSGVIELRVGGLEEDTRDLSWFSKTLGRLFFNFGAVGNFDYTIKAWADGDYARDPFFEGVVASASPEDTKVDDASFLWDEDARWSGPRFVWKSVTVGFGNKSWQDLTIAIEWAGEIILAGVAAEVNYSDVS